MFLKSQVAFLLDYFFLKDQIASPLLKISTNGFFATDREMNNLELGRDGFFDFDSHMKIFRNFGKKNRSIFKFGHIN